MSDKYVIRNCPCYGAILYSNGCDCSWEYSKELYCQDCTDCLLKRIVDECKTASAKSFYGCDCLVFAVFNRILQLLDIQEIE